LTTYSHHKCVDDVNSGKYDDRKKKMIFETFVEKYIDYQKEHKKSCKRDVTSTKVLLLFFKGKYLADIAPLPIARYRHDRLSGKIVVKNKKVTKATVNRECACLSKMFSLAEDWGLVH